MILWRVACPLWLWLDARTNSGLRRFGIRPAVLCVPRYVPFAPCRGADAPQRGGSQSCVVQLVWDLASFPCHFGTVLHDCLEFQLGKLDASFFTCSAVLGSCWRSSVTTATQFVRLEAQGQDLRVHIGHISS